MTRKRKEFPILENITITDVAAEGKALARVDDMVVFVPFVVPGPYLSARISEFAAVASGSVSHIKSNLNTSNSKFWITLPASVR